MISFQLMQVWLSAFWAISATVFAIKSSISFLKNQLTYGKLAPSPSVPSSSSALHPLCLHAWRLRPAVVWPAFYLTGFTASFLLPHFVPQLTVRRFLECVFVHRFTPTRSMPLLQAAAGLAFYIAVALTVMLQSPTRQHPDLPLPSESLHQFFVIALFAIASTAQHLAHVSLANTSPLVGKYGLPTSPLFKYLVCPHYTAEISIYAVLAFHIQTISSFFMFIFVLSNLSITASQTDQWYKQTFPPHILPPPTRYKIIPFTF